MRNTINIEAALLKKASQLTGIEEKTSLIRHGLQAPIARERGRRLAKLGGTEKPVKRIARRRPKSA